MRRLALLLATCLTLLCSTTASGEQRHRIAVLQADEELARAVSLALSPWGVEMIDSAAPLPPPSQPEAVQASSRLAQQLGVEAVIWVSSNGARSLLWVYDARGGEVTTRLLAETPPFNSAAAAAVALSIKTVLRSSVVAPPAERFGARAAPARAERVSALELGAGGHWIARRIEPRVELAAAVWFARKRFGVSARFSTGPGLRIDDPGFRGGYHELVAGGMARLRLLRTSVVVVTAAFGGALNWARLEGRIESSSLGRTVNRLNGSLNGEVSLNFEVSEGLYVGASAGAAFYPTRRRYLLEGRPVFAPGPLGVDLGGHLGVELF